MKYSAKDLALDTATRVMQTDAADLGSEAWTYWLKKINVLRTVLRYSIWKYNQYLADLKLVMFAV